MTPESADPIERWTAKRRVALVGSILKGDLSVPIRSGSLALWWQTRSGVKVEYARRAACLYSLIRMG